MKKNFTLSAFDQKKIPVVSYKISNAKATVQIVHGMAEYKARYEDFALYLNKHKINVYIHDHRGHGENISNGDVAGFFDFHDGWQVCLKDIYTVNQNIKTENPELPLFILGHSMGSFMAREFLYRHPDTANGFIFSGTAASMGLTGHFMIWKAKQESKKNGEQTPSFFLSNTMNKTLNKKFETDNSTGFEWLSNDDAQVKKYIDDPLCGFPSTPNLFMNMAKGNLFVNRFSTINAYPKNMPVLLVSGSDDPVGGKKAIEKIYKQMQKAKMQDVTKLLYAGGRHELLNELNNKEVYYDILQWLENKIS